MQIQPIIKVKIFMLVGLFAVFIFRQFTVDSAKNDEAFIPKAASPSVTQSKLGESRTSQDIELFELTGKLGRSMIHDIVFDGQKQWLATDSGLVSIVGKDITVYRQFDNHPFEWIRHLAVSSEGIAVDTMVASGNTGGDSAGSHLFNPETQSWQTLGKNVSSQVWLDGKLWQIRSRKLLSHAVEDGKISVSEVNLKTALCQFTELDAYDGELWIAQYGVNNSRKSKAGYFGCDTIRFNPQTLEETAYGSEDGLKSEQGHHITADAKGTYISHGVNPGGGSYYDSQAEKWQQIDNSALSLAMSDTSVWLGGNGLVKLDRDNALRKQYVSGIPKNYYVSSIATKGNEVWFGLYKKDWANSSYTITSLLGRYIDQ